MSEEEGGVPENQQHQSENEVEGGECYSPPAAVVSEGHHHHYDHPEGYESQRRHEHHEEDRGHGHHHRHDRQGDAPSDQQSSGQEQRDGEEVPRDLVLYVGGFSRLITDKAIHDLISPVCRIESVSLTRDPRSQESRGFAFVSVSSFEDGNEAIRVYHGTTELGAKSLTVEWVCFCCFLSSPLLSC